MQTRRRAGPVVCLGLIFLSITGLITSTWAQEAAVHGKQWPVNYFSRYQKVSIKEKERLLADIDATLQRVNQDGAGLVVKGTVIDRLDTRQRIYDRLAVLDESGLIVVVRQVPNIYYSYPGPPAALNQNTYLVAKNVKVNRADSFIRYGFVVEGDFFAFAHKFVTAIMGDLENAASRPEGPPELPRRNNP